MNACNAVKTNAKTIHNLKETCARFKMYTFDAPQSPYHVIVTEYNEAICCKTFLYQTKGTFLGALVSDNAFSAP